MTEILFYIFGSLSIVSAVFVVVNRNPIYSALSLVLTFFCLSVIFLLLEAYFLAVVQVIVYAGAIMVLFLFVIMLLNLSREEKFLKLTEPRVLVGVLLSLVFAVLVLLIVFAAVGSWTAGPETAGALGSPQGVGTALFTRYLLPFEIASLLLLAALVGAIMMSKGRLR